MNKQKNIFLFILANLILIMGLTQSNFATIDDTDCKETMEERCERTRKSEELFIKIDGKKEPPAEFTSEGFDEFA